MVVAKAFRAKAVRAYRMIAKAFHAKAVRWLKPAGLNESSLCLPSGCLFRLAVKDRQRYSDPQKGISHSP